MRIRKSLASGAAVAAAALVLTACGGGQTSSTPQTSGAGPSGEINVGVAYATADYGPVTTSALALGTNWHVLEGLYAFDMVDYSVRPALAKGDPVEVSATEYEVALRDGAKFSDGNAVTANDVVASYERAVDPTSIYKQFFTFVDSVTAKDSATVTIKLKHPFSMLKDRFTNVRVAPASMDADALKAQPVGSGPYKYESISPTEVTAVPNDQYNGSVPATAARIRWHVLKDDSARLSAAISGTVDIMEAVPSSAVHQLRAAGWAVEAVPGYNNPFLMFNTTKAPFDKPEVRQAVLRAIDRQKLVDGPMEGQAVVATSFLPESSPAHKKPATDLGHDPQAAKKQLADAGAVGTEITLTTTDHPWIANLVPQVKADLEALGLTVKVDPLADPYTSATDVDEPGYDIVMAPGDPSVFGMDPGIIMSWWNGDNIWTQKRDSWAKTAPDAFRSFQGIVEETVQLEPDDPAALAKWGQAQDLLAEQAVIYPLFHRKMLTAYRPGKVADFSPIAATGLQLLGVSAK